MIGQVEEVERERDPPPPPTDPPPKTHAEGHAKTEFPPTRVTGFSFPVVTIRRTNSAPWQHYN